MVGGERERKGKRKEARFSDLPRPKPNKAELKHALLKKEGFELLKSKGTAFKYCPFDGQLLVGRLAKCSECDKVFGQKLLVGKGASENACLVDVRDYHAAWRRKVFWRMTPPFHTGVVWVTGPPFLSLPLRASLESPCLWTPTSLLRSEQPLENWRQHVLWRTSAGLRMLKRPEAWVRQSF